MTEPALDRDRIASLLAARGGQDPVVSLYLKAWGEPGDRRGTLKNLVREAEQAIDADPDWGAEHKAQARALLQQVQSQGEGLLSGMPTQGRGCHALFTRDGGVEAIRIPVDLPDRLIVDRSPYASPLSSVLDQYERYGVVLCDEKRAILFESYLGEVSGWEELESEHERHRGAPSGGPQRTATRNRPGNYQGLEELRRRNHADYVLHQHLAEVADRVFRRHKVRPFDRLILGGNEQVIPKLEARLHSYLRPRVVAREALPLSLSPSDANARIAAIEARVEQEKEAALLQTVQDQLGATGLATSGLDETLRSLYFGQVDTLIVPDGEGMPGCQCPACNLLWEQPPSTGALECPACRELAHRVPDVIDQAVELAIVSGASVEHIAYEQAKLRELGGAAAILRFK